MGGLLHHHNIIKYSLQEIDFAVHYPLAPVRLLAFKIGPW